jgi:chromate transporter
VSSRSASVSAASTSESTPVSFGEALRLLAKIGWLSFGGPAGQIALMHRELVERRRWISEPRFLHALNYCMLLPGPEAQQLATYIGWLLHRKIGGIIAGALFVLPGMAVMLVLSWLYVRYSAVGPVAAVFFGLKAAVLAVVFDALLRIGRRALKNRFMFGLAAASFIAIHFLKAPFPVIVIATAVIGWLAFHVSPRLLAQTASSAATDDSDYLIDRMHANGQLAHARPDARRALLLTAVCLALWLTPVALATLWLGSKHVLAREGVIFSQTAIITFGGAYAVLAYIAQRAVEELQWLRPGEMIDGLALAETTPGPLILVLQFVGFVAAYRYAGPLDPWLAAVLGALMTTWVTFLPSFLFIFVGAPYMESLRQQRALTAALSAVTAGVVGVILNLSVWFALHTLFERVTPWSYGPIRLEVPVWSTLEPGALVLTVGALIAMLRFRLGMGYTLLASAALGAAYWAWRHSGT